MITTAAYCTSTSYNIDVAFFLGVKLWIFFMGTGKNTQICGEILQWVVINTGKKHSKVIQSGP